MNTQIAVQEYLAAKEALDTAKKLERELRIALLEELFPNASNTTVNAMVGDFQVKGTFKVNTKIDAALLAGSIADLSDEEAECIQYKPSLVAAKYKALEDSELLDECLTTSPALPSIAIKLL